jgi:hypothetical protein
MTFSKRGGLKIHNSEVHGVPRRDEKRMAKQAKKEMAKQAKIQERIAKRKEGLGHFKCTSFTRKSELHIHVTASHSGTAKEGLGHFKCNMCRACFTRKSELDIHVTASHGGTAIY